MDEGSRRCNKESKENCKKKKPRKDVRELQKIRKNLRIDSLKTA